MFRPLITAACFAISGAALAQISPIAAEESNHGLQLIIKQQESLKADLDDGGIDGLTSRQNRLVRTAQDKVFAITGGKTTLEELSMDEKVSLENVLESINAEIYNNIAADDDQNVCWRERVTGTNLKKTRCGTRAEIREAREGARDYLVRPKTCGEGCGS